MIVGFGNRTDLEKAALEFYINNDMERAWPILAELVDRGSGRAMFLLACCYRHRPWNEAEVDDEAVARDLLSMAAEAGDVMGTIEYMRRYESDLEEYEAEVNRLVPKLRDLAEAGDPVAQEYFGRLISDLSRSEGTKWIEAAARSGYWLALEDLGEIYYKGTGTEKDYEKALGCLAAGERLSSARSMLFMGYCYYMGHCLAQNYAEASAYFGRAYRLGDRETAGEAAYMLGIMFKNGQGMEPDDMQSARWIELAAEADYEPAYYELASCYFTGRGVVQDLNHAIELLNISAKTGDRKARVALGSLISLQRGN